MYEIYVFGTFEKTTTVDLGDKNLGNDSENYLLKLLENSRNYARIRTDMNIEK
jgi:hypothetical protein